MKAKSHPSGDTQRRHPEAFFAEGSRSGSFGPLSGPQDDRGSILIACLIILATLTVYGGVLVSAVYERSLNIGVEVDRLQALYLAEAALAKSLNEVKSLSDADGDGLGTVPETKFWNGVYYASHDPGTLAITGVGEVHGIKRRVRIKYEGL